MTRDDWSLDRRRFLALTSGAAASSVAGCVGSGFESVGSGRWSDGSTWSGGDVPEAGASVTVSEGDEVVFDVASANVSGVTIEADATLAFEPTADRTLETDENVLVLGTLRMRPDSQDVTHTLRFVDVDEAAFVGGGMEVVESDVGLWLRGDSRLDARGTPKTSWTNLAGGASAGEPTIRLAEPPNNWRVGDEVVIAPTQDPSDVGKAAWRGFEERTIAAVSGDVVTLEESLARDHPAVTSPNSGERFTAEVMNLTRNVRIEGTGDGSFDPAENGRAHVQILSTRPQVITYVGFRHLGPRRTTDDYHGGIGRHITDNVLGRYPLHFHHAGDRSRGSLIRGTVVRNGGSHAYVPTTPTASPSRIRWPTTSGSRPTGGIHRRTVAARRTTPTRSCGITRSLRR